jgi:uncharacterized protein involved in exopolysaccharide biosynthesis
MSDRDELVRQARAELDHLVSEAGTAAVRRDKAQYDTLIADYVALNDRVKDDPELLVEMVFGVDRLIAAYLGLPLAALRARRQPH